MTIEVMRSYRDVPFYADTHSVYEPLTYAKLAQDLLEATAYRLLEIAEMIKEIDIEKYDVLPCGNWKDATHLRVNGKFLKIVGRHGYKVTVETAQYIHATFDTETLDDLGVKLCILKEKQVNLEDKLVESIHIIQKLSKALDQAIELLDLSLLNGCMIVRKGGIVVGYKQENNELADQLENRGKSQL